MIDKDVVYKYVVADLIGDGLPATVGEVEAAVSDWDDACWDYTVIEWNGTLSVIAIPRRPVDTYDETHLHTCCTWRWINGRAAIAKLAWGVY